jgi:hypothetical protein
VFLEYAEDSPWEPAPQSPLFQGGDLAFAGREPIQLGGEDLGAWDEVVIVDFGSPAEYRAFLGRIAADERLTRYTERWRELFEGPYRGAVVNQESPQDPAGGPESDATTEELHDRYQQKALRVLGKVGAQISVVGSVDRVVAGPEVRHYDDYGFAFYPSVDAFEVVFTARERLDARVHREGVILVGDRQPRRAEPSSRVGSKANPSQPPSATSSNRSKYCEPRRCPRNWRGLPGMFAPMYQEFVRG